MIEWWGNDSYKQANCSNKSIRPGYIKNFTLTIYVTNIFWLGDPAFPFAYLSPLPTASLGNMPHTKLDCSILNLLATTWLFEFSKNLRNSEKLRKKKLGLEKIVWWPIDLKWYSILCLDPPNNDIQHLQMLCFPHGQPQHHCSLEWGKDNKV